MTPKDKMISESAVWEPCETGSKETEMTPREKMMLLLDELLTADPYESAKKARELRNLYNQVRFQRKKRPKREEDDSCRQHA